MELGLTFPLQRFLHQKPPSYGAEADRRFCRDLHVIQLRDRNCLLAVHCQSRCVGFEGIAPAAERIRAAFTLE